MLETGITHPSVSDVLLALREVGGRRPQAHCYILCDRLLFDPTESLSTESGRPLPSLLSIECPDTPCELSPCLVPVDAGIAGEHLVQASIELAQAEASAAALAFPAPRSIAAWLFADPRQEIILRQRLSNRAKLTSLLRNPERKRFHYWDPRVFAQLPRVLGSEVFRSWLGLEVCWCRLEANGVLREFDFVAGETRPPSDDPELAKRLNRIAEINQCLIHVGRAATEDPVLAGPHFDHLLVHAEKIGCQTSVDRMTYAVLADGLGEGFELASQLATCLERFNKGEAAFSVCVADVPEEVWDSVRNAHQIDADPMRS